MQAPSLASCWWPGLPQLWWRGDLRAMMLAVLFAIVLNFALTATFVWPEMVSTGTLAAIWTGVITYWMIAVWTGMREVTRIRSRSVEQQQALFLNAQMEYLKGHWLEAETLLRELLGIDQHDGDARLMLASLLRHSDRAGEALIQLETLELSEAGGKWASEISRERQLASHIQ
jgi:hypothetical protein